MGMIQVINKNPEPYVDMYDGVRYEFNPNVPTVMEEAAARHIFGYGMDEEFQLRKFERAGWIRDRSAESLRAVWAKFHRFIFKEVEADWRASGGVVEQITKEADEKSGAKAGKAA